MSLTPEGALEQAALAGIHCLRIPTPFAVGRVNCYLLEDEPLTLIDTGPNSGKALDELQGQLAEHGHSIDDLELVIVTHQHIDHLGLVEIIVQHSGAEVAGLRLAAERYAKFSEDAEREDSFAVELMLRNGIPEEVAFALQSVSRSFRGWGSRAEVTRPLEDGQALPFRDRVLQALHRPGHSPSDTVFWDEEPRSGYEIAQAIWGNVAVTQAFLTLSEVIGHADLLVNEGRVREVDDGEVIRYEATG